MFQNYGSCISCGVIRDIKLGAKYLLTLTSLHRINSRMPRHSSIYYVYINVYLYVSLLRLSYQLVEFYPIKFKLRRLLPFFS
jgi:hypothetical protein